MLEHFNTLRQSAKSILIVIAALAISPIAASAWVVMCDRLMQNGSLDPEENFKIIILGYALWMSIVVPYFSKTIIPKRIVALIMAAPCLLVTMYAIANFDTAEVYIVMIWPIVTWAYLRLRGLNDWHTLTGLTKEKLKLRTVRMGIMLYTVWLLLLFCVAQTVGYYDDIVYVMSAPLPLIGLWAFKIIARWIRAGQ